MNQTSNTWRILSWVAVGLLAIPVALEAIDSNYLRAAGQSCLMLAFLLSLMGGKSEKPRWQNIALLLLIVLCVGFFAYRFV